MSSPIRRIIVGTAGHIDHGKSTLVQALTGVDPDRLKEEQERGMTIDLGFAPYLTESGGTVGIIDVPGHERFVKNMVAGASSVDVFLLVVAADDGVMPQTREHVEILSLLGATRGLVAVTKCDAVDGDLVELVLDDVREYLGATPFADVPIIPVSAQTGDGVDRLKSELNRLISEAIETPADGLFRMPIQRVFSSPGHGTVVTGVPVSGEVRLGDTLEILPSGFRGRVRGIQAYKEQRDVAVCGHSAALNLSDIDHHEVSRGQVVVTPGFFHPVRFLECQLHYLASAARPLKHGMEVRLHVGTSETLARVVLLEGTILKPGGEALVQLRFKEPVVATRGDRFLIRQVSPAITLGGGLVVSDSDSRLPGQKASSASAVRSKADSIEDLPSWLSFSLTERGFESLPEDEVAKLLKCPKDQAGDILADLIEGGQVVRLPRGRLMHFTHFGAACDLVCQELQKFHEKNPLKASSEALGIRQAAKLEEAVFDGAVESLVQEERLIEEEGRRLRLAGMAPRLGEEEILAREKLASQLLAAALKPPSIEELSGSVGLGVERVRALLDLMTEEGELFLAAGIYFHASLMEGVLDVLREVAGNHDGELLVPEVRDRLGTTRKYLIPILEAMDSKGHTVRRGDRRYFVERNG